MSFEPQNPEFTTSAGQPNVSAPSGQLQGACGNSKKFTVKSRTPLFPKKSAFPSCSDTNHGAHECEFKMFTFHPNPMRIKKHYYLEFMNVLSTYEELSSGPQMDKPARSMFLRRGFVAFMLNSQDAAILFTHQAEKIKILYEMRRRCGLNGDYGFRSLLNIDVHNHEFALTCNHTSHSQCECWFIFQNRTHCDVCYSRWQHQTCQAIVSSSLALAMGQTKKQRKEVVANLRCERAARQVVYAENSELSELFLAQVYQINVDQLYTLRSILGDCQNHGEFISFAESFLNFEWINSIIVEPFLRGLENAKTATQNGYVYTKDSIKAAYGFVKDKIMNWFGGISGTIGAYLTSKIEALTKWVSDTYESIKEAVTPTLLRTFTVVLTMTFIVIAGLCGIFATKTVMRLFYGETSSYAAESECPSTAVTTFCGRLFSLTGKRLETIANVSRQILSLTAGATLGFGALAGIFGILPYAVRRSVIERFGTDAMRTEYMYADWRALGFVIISCSKISAVVASDYYKEITDKFMNDGMVILKNIDAQKRTEANSLIAKVTGIVSNLASFHNASGQRPVPFSIHLSGPPGIGKSTIVSSIQKDVFQIPDTKVYNVPTSDQFWSGFVHADMIVWDEFLVANDPQGKVGAMYLQLASSIPFQPPLASTDSVTVGIKGTPCNPEVVMTINNSSYQAPPGVDRMAYFRRRNVVIEMLPDKDYLAKFGHQGAGNVPLAKFPVEDVKSFKWIKFYARNPTDPEGKEQPIRMTFEELKTFLKVKRHEHQAMNKILNNAQPEQVDPVAIIKRVTAETYGIPTEAVSATDVLLNVATEATSESDMECEYCKKIAEKKGGTPGKKIVVKPSTCEDHQKRYFITRMQCVICRNFYRDCALDRRDRQFDCGKHFVIARLLDSGLDAEGFFDLVTEFNNYIKYEGATTEVESQEFCQQFLEGLEGRHYASEQEARTRYMDFVERLPASGDNEWRFDEFYDWKLHRDRLLKKIHVLDSERRCEICQAEYPLVETNNPAIELSNENLVEVHEPIQFEALQREVPEENQEPAHQFEEARVFLERQTEVIMQQIEDACEQENGSEHSFDTAESEDQETVSFLSNLKSKVKKAVTFPEDLVLEVQRVEFSTPLTEDYFRMSWSERIFFNFKHLPAYWTDMIKTDFTDEDAARAFVARQTMLSDGVQTIFKALKIFSCLCVIAYFVKNLISKKETKTQDFSWLAESTMPQHVTTPTRKNRPRRLDESFAEASVPIYTINACGQTVKGFPIGQRTLLTVSHLFDNFKADTTKVSIEAPTGEVYNIELLKKDIVVDSTHDVAIFDVPHSTFPSSKNLLNKFPTESEIATQNNFEASLKIAAKEHVLQIRDRENVTYSSTVHKYQVQRGLAYIAPTVFGTCGSPLICLSSRNAGKIIGMHVAGVVQHGTKVGLGVRLTRSIVQDCLDVLRGNEIPDVEGTTAATVESLKDELSKYDQEPNNIISITEVPKGERVHTPSKTKLKQSLLHGMLSERSIKQPAVLSNTDMRSKVPVEASLIKRWNVKNTTQPDMDIIQRVENEMFENYSYAIEEGPVRPGMLTIEQAIGGIPGKLSSLKLSTSPGYPMVKIKPGVKGKHGCWSYIDDRLEVDQTFQMQVEALIDRVLKGDVEGRGRFLVFLKDELVSKEKVEEGRTRAIYANDVVALVAFRMFYGATLANLHAASSDTPLAIVMNPASYDMDSMHTYLSEVGDKFIAGDYKNFDLTYNKHFQRAAYRLFFRLNGDTCQEMDKFLYNHEAKQPILQFGERMYQLDTIHTSGCFLTTIINCFVNEMYLRYCFEKLCPLHGWDDRIRLKVLGDDHVICVGDDIPEFNPVNICKEMKKLGLIYTSDIKDQELSTEYRTFEDITFLGCHPRLVEGRYVGAPKQSTLWQMPQWTRTNNEDLEIMCETAVRYAAMWDEEFYSKYATEVYHAMSLKIPGRKMKPIPLWANTRHREALRTASSGVDYVWRAEAFEQLDLSQARAESKQIGITTIKEVEFEEADEDRNSRPVKLTYGIQDVPVDIDYGVGSWIYRSTYTWTTSDSQNKELVSIPIPYGLLNLGEGINVQNMNFDRFIYFKADVEILIQIVGTPFQQGAVLAYFTPLGHEAGPVMRNMFYSNKILAPNRSTSTILTYKYNYYRNFMNTYSIPEQTERMATFRIDVLSPLITMGTDKEVSISIYSRFTNAEFYLPRPPRSMAAYAALAEGASVSKVSNTYNVAHVAGNVPIGTSVQSNPTQKTDSKVDASAMPLDNPPMNSGTIPLYPVLPSRSKTVGISTAVGLMHHPEEMNREHHQFVQEGDSSVVWYCSRDTVANMFEWKASQEPGTILLKMDLNSLLSTYKLGDPNVYAPTCAVPLNWAWFWRADIVITFVGVMTDFHSGRLRVSIAYGASDFVKQDATVFKNHVMDFTTGSETNCIRIPFNAGTEFLKTLRRKDYEHPKQETSLGILAVTVANRLICPETVSKEVTIMPFIHLENVQLREVTQIPPYQTRKIFDGTSVPVSRWLAESGVAGEVRMDAERDDQVNTAVPVDITETEPEPTPLPCKLQLGRKFEYCWSDFLDIGRRYVQSNDVVYDLTAPGIYGYAFSVAPALHWKNIFYAWAGRINYRIMVRTKKPTEVTVSLIPYVRRPNINDFLGGLDANPCENTYPIGPNVNYIDVAVPFNSIYNYHPIDTDVANKIPRASQTLGFFCEEEIEFVSLYEKLGDDFRFMMPLPVNELSALNGKGSGQGIQA